MELNDYINKIKFQLTGNVLELEIDDAAIKENIDIALQDVNRYYTLTKLISVPGARCIDLCKVENDNNIKINSIADVFRTKTIGMNKTGQSIDPMFLSAWNIGNGYYGSQAWLYNYASYNTNLQIANTMSTDLDIKEDKLDRKLYINYSQSVPEAITIEYIPLIRDVSEIVDSYWTNILLRLATAYAKISVARIRTRYTQDNAIWKQDGETLLEEGKTDLKEILDRLQEQASYVYPID